MNTFFYVTLALGILLILFFARSFWKKCHNKERETVVHLIRPTTSAIKTIYCVSFVIFLFSSFFNLFLYAQKATPLLIGGRKGDAAIFLATFWIAIFFTLMHMLRIYMSVELAENPFSTINTEFLRKLTKRPHRIAESLTRLLLVIMVSLVAFKHIKFFHDQLHIESIKFVSIYFALVYLVCLMWDLLMIALIPIISWHEKRVKTFIIPSVSGFIGWLVIAYNSYTIEELKKPPQGGYDYLIITLFGTGLIMLGLGYSFYVHRRSTKKTFEEWLEDILASLLSPYTGEA